MRTHIHLTLLIALISLLFGCKKDDISSRDFPRLKTLEVTDTTNSGATLNAEIINRGNFEILEYGFAWGCQTKPTTENTNHVIISGAPISNKFSTVISTSLKSYTIRAYIKTANYTVYGQTLNKGKPKY